MRIFKTGLLSIIALAAITCLSAAGCGSLSGDTGAGVAVSRSATINDSPAVLSLIARSVSDGFSSLKTPDKYYSARLMSIAGGRYGKTADGMAPEKMVGERTGVGTLRIFYGPADAVDIFGVTCTFVSGTQIYQSFDLSGAPLDDKTLADAIVITDQSLAFRCDDNGSAISAVSNGKLKISGFQNKTAYSITYEDYSIEGTINGNSFTWKRDGRVEIDPASFPFPGKGQSESSVLTFNGADYKNLIIYSGTSGANGYINGPVNLSASFDLGTGKVQNIAGGITASLDDRFSLSPGGVITDKVTRLQWYRSSEMKFNWRAAFNWTKALSASGGGWTMPAYEQLNVLYGTAGGSADYFPAETWSNDNTGPTCRCVGTWSPAGYDKSRGETVETGVLAVRPLSLSNPVRIQTKYYRHPDGIHPIDSEWLEHVINSEGMIMYKGMPYYFYRVVPGGAGGEFKALGDLMLSGWSDYAAQNPVICRFAKTGEAPDALANPVGFEWQGDNAHTGYLIGSKSQKPTLHYFRMLPPAGYVALGYCYRGSLDSEGSPSWPKKEDYWCVKKEYLTGVGSRELFNDSGTGWSYHDLNVYEGVLLPGQTARPGRELRIPSVSKGYCTGSGHPNPGPPVFNALDLPQGAWPVPQ